MIAEGLRAEAGSLGRNIRPASVVGTNASLWPRPRTGAMVSSVFSAMPVESTGRGKKVIAAAWCSAKDPSLLAVAVEGDGEHVVVANLAAVGRGARLRLIQHDLLHGGGRAVQHHGGDHREGSGDDEGDEGQGQAQRVGVRG